MMDYKKLFALILIIISSLLISLSISHLHNNRITINIVKVSTVDSIITYKVTATTYYPSVKQTDKTPYRTSINAKINKKSPNIHRWMAVSRDLLRTHNPNAIFDYNDTVVISGCPYWGCWIIKDCMNKRFSNRIDFLISKDDIGGKWDNVKLCKYK